jgi:hypothetical protein
MNITDADPELLVALVDRTRAVDAKLLLPDVVKLEYARKVPEELSAIREQTKTFRKSVTTSVLPGPDVSRIHSVLDKLDSDRDAAATRAQEYLEQLSSDHDVTIPIALNSAVIAEAVKYVLAGDMPSRGPSESLLDPDSLIVASAVLFARSQGLTRADTLLICSNNHKDFAQWDPDQEMHILAETIAARIPCPARYYKSLRPLLEKELETDIQADKSLSDALDAYDQLTDTMSSISINANLLENMRRAFTINSDVLENIRRMPTVDPDVLENMRRAFAMDPNIVHHLRESLDASDLDDDADDETVVE